MQLLPRIRWCNGWSGRQATGLDDKGAGGLVETFDIAVASVLDQTQITEPGVANYTDNESQREDYKVWKYEEQEPVKEANVEKQNAKENAFAKLAQEQAKAQQERWCCPAERNFDGMVG
eukprot:766663-Hanusia_phi.AAC.4